MGVMLHATRRLASDAGLPGRLATALVALGRYAAKDEGQRAITGAHGILAIELMLFVLLAPALRAAQEPGAIPFAGGVVSTPLFACATIAADGGTVYFSRSEPAAKKSSIMQSRLADVGWTEPVVASFSGTYNEGDPALSPDGSRLVFWSWRPIDGKPAVSSALWYVERQGASWSAPVLLMAGGTLVYGWGPSVTASGTIYFFRGGPNPGGPPWLSRIRLVNGRYAAAEYLDARVNGAFGGGDTGIAPDESFLVFSSSRPDGLGASDLYVSERLGEAWTEPRNLGPKVNSRENEMCPSVAGRELLFSRSGQGIFRIPLDALGLGGRR